MNSQDFDGNLHSNVNPQDPQLSHGKSAKECVQHRIHWLTAAERRRLFLNDIQIANCEGVGRRERLAACDRLAGWIGEPHATLAVLAEAYRKGGPALWAQTVMHHIGWKIPFGLMELATLAPCSPCRIRKPCADKGCVEVMHLNVLLAILHHSGYAIHQLPPLPTERQWAIAGLCHATPRLFAFHDGRSNPDVPRRKSTHSSLPFKVGAVIDVLITHERLHLLGMFLPAVEMNEEELRGRPVFMDVLGDCVHQANQILDEYPLLMEALGPVTLDGILADMGPALQYLESWFLCRELFAESVLDNGDRLGIFV